MRRYRKYSIEFKRRVVEEYKAGETVYGLSNRHKICQKLIRLWIAGDHAGTLFSDAAMAEFVQHQEERIAALERMVGKLLLENDFLKTASRLARSARSDNTSVIAGPPVSLPLKDVG